VRGRLERRSTLELEVGDELVFAAGTSRDIFESLVSQVEERPEMREVVRLSELWWRSLLGFMQSTGQRVRDILMQLSDRGFHYEPGTIIAWIQGERMWPGRYPVKTVIAAIAEITGDELLASRTDEVRKACGKRQSLHIKLGKYLVQQITRAAAGESGEGINNAFRPIVDELARHAEVVTVYAVADTPSRVRRSVSNRLIRERKVTWVGMFDDIVEV